MIIWLLPFPIHNSYQKVSPVLQRIKTFKYNIGKIASWSFLLMQQITKNYFCFTHWTRKTEFWIQPKNRQHSTGNWEKHGEIRLWPLILRHCPCGLLMIGANMKCTRNWIQMISLLWWWGSCKWSWNLLGGTPNNSRELKISNRL